MLFACPAADDFFRSRIDHKTTAQLDQVLLRSINSQLEHRGLKVQGSRGAILDATIIPSAARPNSYIDIEGEEHQMRVGRDSCKKQQKQA